MRGFLHYDVGLPRVSPCDQSYNMVSRLRAEAAHDALQRQLVQIRNFFVRP